MFTGLIEDLGTLRDIRSGKDQAVLTVGTSLPVAEIELGESIAINGVCLTVTRLAEGSFSADVSPETLGCTTLGRLSAGARVNLERALRLSDHLGEREQLAEHATAGRPAPRRKPVALLVFAKLALRGQGVAGTYAGPCSGRFGCQ